MLDYHTLDPSKSPGATHFDSSARSRVRSMETYYGYIRTCADAILILQACQDRLLPRLQGRLSERQRQSIRSGSVFVWDEDEGGMRRWTDGRSWSSSRVNGRFLAYREMEKKTHQTKSPRDDGHILRFKVNGLIKQSFSITAMSGQRLHLISYHSQNSADDLQIPITDPTLQSICPRKSFFPIFLVNDLQNFSVFAREQAEATRSKSRPELSMIPPPTHSFKSTIPSEVSIMTMNTMFPNEAPVSAKVTDNDCSPHDQSNPPNRSDDSSSYLPSPQNTITDPCRGWSTRNCMLLPSLPQAPQKKTITQISSSVSKSHRSQRETPPTYNKAPLLSHILS